MEREVSLPEVAAAHAEALSVQIRVLRLRYAVRTAVAERGSTPDETESMHKLSQLTEEQRRDLIDDFLNAVFGDLDAPAHGGPEMGPTGPEFTAIVRSMTPELPDDPHAEQARAWVELAELSLDTDFRATVRRMVEEYSAEQQPGAAVGPRPDLAADVRAYVGPALAAGIAGGR